MSAKLAVVDEKFDLDSHLLGEDLSEMKDKAETYGATTSVMTHEELMSIPAEKANAAVRIYQQFNK